MGARAPKAEPENTRGIVLNRCELPSGGSCCRCWPLASRFRWPPVGETPDPRETLGHKDPQVRKEPKASKVSQVFRGLPVLKTQGPQGTPGEEKRAKLQP